MNSPSSAPKPQFPHELMSRDTWHAQLEMEVETAKATGAPASVIFMDVNGFKSINDKLGHVKGDEVIAELGELLRLVTSQLRLDDPGSSDTTGRTTDKVSFGFKNPDMPIDALAGHIGGDEFAIFANTDETGAKVIRERARTAFDDYIAAPRNHALAGIDGIGLAIGVATLDLDMTSKDLLEAADKDMFRDKIDQLPLLDEGQKKALWAAHIILAEAGIPAPHFLKYPTPEL